MNDLARFLDTNLLEFERVATHIFEKNKDASPPKVELAIFKDTLRGLLPKLDEASGEFLEDMITDCYLSALSEDLSIPKTALLREFIRPRTPLQMLCFKRLCGIRFLGESDGWEDLKKAQAQARLIISGEADFAEAEVRDDILEYVKTLAAGFLKDGGRIVECTRCGRRFAVSANYPTKYCDVKGKGGKSCRDIAPMETYNKKRAGDPLLRTSHAVYNSMHRRIGKSITAEEFGDFTRKLTAIKKSGDRDELSRFLEELDERMPKGRK